MSNELTYASFNSIKQTCAMWHKLSKPSNIITDQTTLRLISGYQRYLSPIKGFKCAAGQVYGDSTCSAVIKAIVQNQGLVAGFPAIQHQLKQCHAAAKYAKAHPGQFQAGAFCCILPIPL